MNKRAGLCQLTVEALHAALQLPSNVRIKSWKVKPATQLTTDPEGWVGGVPKSPCEVLQLHLEGGDLPAVSPGDAPRWVQPMYGLSKDKRPNEIALMPEFQYFAVLR